MIGNERRGEIEIKSASCTLAQMSFAEFQQSVARDSAPPADASSALQALWHSAGQQNAASWELAHRLVQDDSSRDGAWVHAYLHRKEGDTGNAGYWYARARRPLPAEGVTLEAEWAEIARALLGEK